MAFVFRCRESMKQWWRRTTMVNLNHRSFATCTTPKLAPITADGVAHDHAKPRGKLELGEWVPIMVLGGMIGIALSVGVHTAKQQLCHSPVVQISKKRREMVSEVDNPDVVVSSADKFVNKSFLRKLAYIQDTDVLPHSTLHNPFTRSREIENLESVGVAYRDRRH